MQWIQIKIFDLIIIIYQIQEFFFIPCNKVQSASINTSVKAVCVPDEKLTVLLNKAMFSLMDARPMGVIRL
jgi:hypothetical protein